MNEQAPPPPTDRLESLLAQLESGSGVEVEQNIKAPNHTSVEHLMEKGPSADVEAKKIKDILASENIEPLKDYLGFLTGGKLNKKEMDARVAEEFYRDLLTSFTANPENKKFMDDTVVAKGESFFLNTVKNDFLEKIAPQYSLADQERLNTIVTDRVNFGYFNIRLGEVVKANPEISDIVERTSKFDQYSQLKPYTISNIESMAKNLEDLKVDIDSKIFVGKEHVESNGTVSHLLNFDDVDRMIDQYGEVYENAKSDLKKAYDDLFDKELSHANKFFDLGGKSKRELDEARKKIGEVSDTMTTINQDRFKIIAKRNDLFTKDQEVQKIISGVGFPLATNEIMTVEQYFKRLNDFLDSPKFTPEEKKIAKEYAFWRTRMDAINNEYHFPHKHWVGSDKGNAKISGFAYSEFSSHWND